MNIHEVLINGCGAFLFGSRSKNSEVEGSDWDYAVENSVPHRAFLEGVGFVFSEFESPYQDTLSVAVGENPDYPGIQVILKDQLDVFRRAWKSISIDRYRLHYSKRSILYMGFSPDAAKSKICYKMDSLIKNTEGYVPLSDSFPDFGNTELDDNEVI